MRFGPEDMTPPVEVAIDLASGQDQTAYIELFPWVRMTPERPDDYPEQAWFLEGRNKVVPGVSLVVPHQLATRAHLGLRLSNGGSSFECALTFPPKELRALAQALLSAAALIDELLPAMEGGAR